MKGRTIDRYVGCQLEQLLDFPGRQFRLFFASAYDAMGLIGPECNGLVILDETRRKVVLDEHFQESTGYFGPSDRQQRELERIAQLDWAAFAAFCDSHPRSRQPLEEVLPNISLPRIFKASQFRATEWTNSKQKAKFANELARFVQSGYHCKYWTPKLYVTLSNCFGHIAHYNMHGFYQEWFATQDRQAAWREWVERATIYGDPEITYSDVERAFQMWLRQHAGEALCRGVLKR